MKNSVAKSLLFIAALVWGFSFVVMKTASDALDVYALLALRFSGAFIVLAAVFYKKLIHMNLKDLFAGFVVSLTVFAAYVAQTFGLTDTTPGKNAFLTAVYCVLVPFIYWLTDKKKPDAYNIIAAVLCLGGIALVSLDSALTIGIGDALTLVGGIIYSVQIVTVAKVCRSHDPILITVLQFGFSAVFAWIFHFATEPAINSVSPEILWQIAFLAVFSTAAAFLCQNVGQKYSNPSSAAIILSLESVFGVLFSIIFGYETTSPRVLIGFAVIFVSVIISETKLSFLRKNNAQ